MEMARIGHFGVCRRRKSPSSNHTLQLGAALTRDAASLIATDSYGL
jgi:hypothetical protein